ncbi:MAG: SRPBCC family protein [Betaproteobacteria bacterium]|nr:SRPBCC family protein [Betaproteobacteria bacterium]
MKRLHIMFAVFFNLFLVNTVLAEDGEPSGNKKVAPLLVKREAMPYNDDIQVEVWHDGEQITVEAAFVVPVAPRQAWAVLTDFENIPSFNSGVLSSRITGRKGNNLYVRQKGISKYGVLSFSFESVREIHLIPLKKIQERMISGSMRKMEETTQLSPEGKHTRITYHAVFIPGMWVPPLLGDVFIKHEARGQFQQLTNEIIRRQRVNIADHEP